MGCVTSSAGSVHSPETKSTETPKIGLPRVSVTGVESNGNKFCFEPHEWRSMVGEEGHENPVSGTYPVFQVRGGERVWTGFVTVNRSGATCFGSRTVAPSTGQWQVNDILDYGTTTDCEWRYADAATGKLASLNPLRWSGATSFEHAVADLEKEQRQKERPIILKIPSGVMSRERRFDSCAQAIAHLKSPEGIRDGDRRFVHEWKANDNWNLGADDADFDDSIPRIDRKMSYGVTEAIAALKANGLLAEAGICIVYSSAQSQYFLLAREDQKDLAEKLWNRRTCRN